MTEILHNIPPYFFMQIMYVYLIFYLEKVKDYSNYKQNIMNLKLAKNLLKFSSDNEICMDIVTYI